jgi:hypothetical protein
MAKEIELTGKVPISITVDLETRRITEVHVLDEEAVIDLPRFEKDHEWIEAAEIAEEGAWPAWEFGS